MTEILAQAATSNDNITWPEAFVLVALIAAVVLIVRYIFG